MDVDFVNRSPITKPSADKIMYQVQYTQLGGGVLMVKASSKEEAEKLAYNVSQDILLEKTDIKNGFEVMSVEQTEKDPEDYDDIS